MLTSDISFQNELLRELLSLPVIARYLLPELEVVPLTRNQVLYEFGDNIEYVYFPLDSVVSGMAIMHDGTTMETSMVGRDGMVDISTILGSQRSLQWTWVTIGGSAIKVKREHLDELCVKNEAALKLVFKAYRALITQVSQRCVCNTRHTILERLSCWFLMIHDRVGDTSLNLTQEMIASRVCVRRSGITVAGGVLQQMGAISYRRGRLLIEDREALTESACECYHIMRDGLTYPSSD